MGLPAKLAGLLAYYLAVNPDERHARWEQVEATLAAAYEESADHPAPERESVAALSRAERVAVVEVGAAIPPAVPAVALDVRLEGSCGLVALLDGGVVALTAGQVRETHQHVVQEEGEPDALASAVLADAVQAALALDRAIPPWSAGTGMSRWHFLAQLMLRAARQGQVAEGLRAVEEMEKMLQEDADEDDE